MDAELESALNAIDPSSLDYNQWIDVGMALKQEGYSYEKWDEWSRNDPRWKPNVCQRKWNSFKGDGIAGGTIIKMAKDHGWEPDAASSHPSSNTVKNIAFGWNDTIEDENEPDQHTTGMSPAEELETYLNVLFESTDRVGYVTESWQDEDGKWKPTKGSYTYTAGDLIQLIHRYDGDLRYALGDWNEEAGAWIRINPLDGKGASDDNVVKYNHVLIESDTLPLEVQKQKFREFQLPIAAMVYSGGKSIHAVVKVDAADETEYKERVNFLFDFLHKKGIDIDKQNKNPSRMSRMPGVTRNGNHQSLIAVNIGKPSWAAWKEWVDGEDLPPIVNFAEYLKHPIPLAEELIEGVLRRGHKMLITGASKTGKSFLMIELAVALAEGETWLKFKCKRGKVLYINLEIDEASSLNRVANVYEKMSPPEKYAENLFVWNLRGKAETLDKLTPKLVERVRDMDFDAILIDPIYKVLTGDENSAADMGKFCNEFDKIATQTGASVIYCHHHAKGGQGNRKAIDRGSGSGVFGRDPDAQMDVTELVLTDSIKNFIADDNARGFRIEANLREFPPIKPFEVWFRYPVHELDDDNHVLAKLYEEGERNANLSKSSKATTSEERHDLLTRAFDMVVDNGFADQKALAEYMEVSEQTVKNYVDEFSDEFSRNKGTVIKLCKDSNDED